MPVTHARRRWLTAARGGRAAVALAFLLAGTPQVRADAAADAAWAGVPGILQRIVPPTFLDRSFAITDYGAKAGGRESCTSAFATAIARCVEGGGGRVVVPAGVYLTGPIHLASHVELHLEAGAEVVFSDRFEDYLPVVQVRVGGIDVMNYSPLVYAKDCTDIAITGKGKLNGNAARWWQWKGKETTAHFQMGASNVPLAERVFGTPEAAMRPNFLVLLNCRNLLLEDFTIGSGPNWTIHPTYCENVIIRRVTVDTHGPNNDGIDPDSCRNVLIEHCTFKTGDDCVVLKSGYNEDGWRVGKPTENVVMRHCSSNEGHGGLVIGSEMSGGVRNVYMHDCEFEGTDRAVRIKSRIDRGGVVENVWVENVKAKNMQREVVILNMDYSSDKQELVVKKPPIFRNMAIRHVTAEGAPVAITITGVEESPIENIRFEDVTIASTKGVVCSEVKGLKFENVKVTPTTGPVFDLKDASQIAIQGAVAPKGTDVFLKLEGKESGGVTIENSDLSGAKEKFVIGPGVAPDAVVVK